MVSKRTLRLYHPVITRKPHRQVNRLHFYSAFLPQRHSKRFTICLSFTHSYSHSHIAAAAELPCKALACPSGATWGSESCSRILWHMAWEESGIKLPTLGLTDDPLYLLSHSRPSDIQTFINIKRQSKNESGPPTPLMCQDRRSQWYHRLRAGGCTGSQDRECRQLVLSRPQTLERSTVALYCSC